MEPNEGLYMQLKYKNRNAAYVNACLSITEFPEEVEFVNAEGAGGIKGYHI